MRPNLIVMLALASIVLGCTKDEEVSPSEMPASPAEISPSPTVPGVHVGAEERTLDSLQMEDVILKVNGKPFTKADFELTSSLYDMITRMRAHDPLRGPNPAAEKTKLWRRPFTLSDIARRAMVRDFARAEGIAVRDEDRKAAAKSVADYVRYPDKTPEMMAKEFGGAEGRLFLEYLEGDALDEAVRCHFDVSNALNITEADVIAYSNRYENSIRTAVLSNEVEKAILSKASAELAKGRDFVEVAKEFSINLDDATVWGEEINLDELEDCPELMGWVSTANAGDVSGIIATEDSWSIVKVVERGKDEDEEGNIGEDNWTLVRICRTYWDSYQSMTHDEIVDMLKDSRKRKLQREIGEMIDARSVIEWPYGTNLFKNANLKKGT